MKCWIAAAVLFFGAGLAMAAIDVNTASPDLLEELHGIGPARARAIIEYRQQHGPFKSLDQLLEIKGIGEATLERMRPQLVIGGPAVQVKKSAPAGPANGPRYFGDTPPH